MKKILILYLMLFITLAPTKILFAQDDYEDDYDTEYEDYEETTDEGEGEEGFTDVWENADITPGTNTSGDFKWFGLSLVFKGGLELDIAKKFQMGGVFETTMNMDISYVFLQTGMGWSSHWSRIGVDKAISGQPRSRNPFNAGWYFLAGAGFVIPQYGVRLSGGIQGTMAMAMDSFYDNYSDELVPYIELTYERQMIPGVYWNIGLRTVLTGVKFKDNLPDNGSKAIVDLSVGLSFYLL